MNVTESNVISTRLKNVSSQFTVMTSYFNQELEDNSFSNKNVSDIIDYFVGISMSRIQIIDRDFNIITDTYQINRGKLCISQDVNKCFKGTNSAYTDKANQCIIMVQGIKQPESDEVSYVMFATSSISDIYSAMATVRLIATSVMIILIIIILFFAFFLSGLLVKPFGNINQVIEEIDKGHRADDINLRGCSEVEDISASFNIMLRRINQLEASRQEFVSNVSHELKTPLTSMKVLADSLLMNEDVPVELYREFMENMSGEIDRENAIISDLLTLVKLDNSDSKLNISACSINEMLESTLKMVKPLAERKNIELILESRPVTADVDEVKLSMAISNLVENAIKYNNPEGWVHVSLNADQTYFYIKVQDNGFGIPKEAQEHVFDRFYRVDKARDRATGGTGLGLSITRSLILAHNGEIRLYSEEGVGTTFSIQIPLTYVNKAKHE